MLLLLLLLSFPQLPGAAATFPLPLSSSAASTFSAALLLALDRLLAGLGSIPADEREELGFHEIRESRALAREYAAAAADDDGKEEAAAKVSIPPASSAPAPARASPSAAA